MKILYIEDEPADAQLVERYMQLTPHQLVLASNLVDARAAMNTQPDLILVDVLLGRARDGYRFIQEMRGQGYGQPIIAVTGLSTPYDIEQCYQSGVDEVLTKPYAINQLIELLSRYTA
jgi:CheY-like chemotaxis protein